MSSLKQIEANRRNALKSTGPITAEGKERSRCNAVRHGLTAETVIADLEDAEDYKAFEAAIIVDYDAQTAVERELVLRLASALWRLRRAIGIESGIFESIGKGTAPIAEHIPELTKSERRASRLYVVGPSTNSDDTIELDPKTKATIADRFLQLAELPTSPLDRLSRYERLLWRQAKEIVVTLRILTRGRRQPEGQAHRFARRPWLF